MTHQYICFRGGFFKRINERNKKEWTIFGLSEEDGVGYPNVFMIFILKNIGQKIILN